VCWLVPLLSGTALWALITCQPCHLSVAQNPEMCSIYWLIVTAGYVKWDILPGISLNGVCPWSIFRGNSFTRVFLAALAVALHILCPPLPRPLHGASPFQD
jgi:hypothetical protein